MSLPDFLIIGAPKAGSTALHDALLAHPQLFLSVPKEPKFFLTGGVRPDRAHQRGPGDAHSAQEWIWDRRRYEHLFDRAPEGALKGESTPFYLWDLAAHQRIKDTIPEVKMIAVIRDPIDRAYSNWTHLWCDGLETEADFLAACDREPERIRAGYAPFWRYLETGLYGQQLAHLLTMFPREQLFLTRYRRLVDDRVAVLDEICRFLGVETSRLTEVPRSNVSNWVPDTRANSVLRGAVRVGAHLGAHVPPKVWRRAQRPLLAALHRAGGHRPVLATEVRRALLPYFAADTKVLEDLTGLSFADWRKDTGRGSFGQRTDSNAVDASVPSTDQG